MKKKIFLSFILSFTLIFGSVAPVFADADDSFSETSEVADPGEEIDITSSSETAIEEVKPEDSNESETADSTKELEQDQEEGSEENSEEENSGNRTDTESTDQGIEEDVIEESGPDETIVGASHTRDEAVNWVYSQEGKYLDYDGAYGAQCVDLIKYYYNYFGVAGYAMGNGYQYATNTLPPNWTRIQNTPDFVPEPGDIAVWTTGVGGGYGHVAIILSANVHSFVSMDQNWPKGSACCQVTHNYNNFWGVIRPDYAGHPVDPWVVDQTYAPFLPASAYALTTGKVTLYDYYKNPYSLSTRYIDGANDLCVIEAVYTNGFCLVKYPSTASSSGYNEERALTSDFIPSCSPSAYTANRNYTAYRRPDWGDTIGEVYGNDYCLKLSTSGSLTQIIYPTSSSHKIGWIEMDPEGPTYTVITDYGDDFYAYIIADAANSWKHISKSNVNSNVEIPDYNDSLDPKQIWHFIKQSDNSYKIINEYNGAILDADAAVTTSGANVGVYPEDNGWDNQRWYIARANGGGITLISKYTNLSLDCNGGSFSPGTNIQVWELNNTAAQNFCIYNLERDGRHYSKPDKPDKITLGEVNECVAGVPFTISWTEAGLKSDEFDTRTYDVRIYKDGIWMDSYFGLTDTSVQVTLNEAGSYSYSVAAVNTKYYEWYYFSELKDFSVNKAKPVLSFESSNVSKNTADAAFTNILTKTTDGAVTFTSSNENVATVNSTSGEVTIRGVGTTTITADSAETDTYESGSASYTLTVTMDLKIVSISDDFYGKTGTQASFHIEAEGSGSVSYQWQYRTAGMTEWKAPAQASAKTSDYVFNLKPSYDNIEVRCVVSDDSGNEIISDVRKANVFAFTSQPADAAAAEGEDVNFEVSAIGRGVTYQWYYMRPNGVWNMTTVNGSRTAVLPITAGTKNDGTSYRCVITDEAGNQITSAPGILTVERSLRITGMSEDAYAVNGKSVNFHIDAAGKGMIAYQWQYRTASMSDWKTPGQASAKTADYSFNMKPSYNNIEVRCIVSDESGSEIISETRKADVFAFTSQPADVTVSEGQVVNFEVSAIGHGVSYQWYYMRPNGVWNKTTVSGSRTSVLPITAGTKNDGTSYRCVITDEEGNQITSAAGILTLDASLKITGISEDAYDVSGESVTFHIDATGKGDLTYQWQYKLAGDPDWRTPGQASAKTADYVFKLRPSYDNIEVRCIVQDAYGNSATSDVRKANVFAITGQPKSAEIERGEKTTFAVKAVGKELTYQWYYMRPEGSWNKVTVAGYNTAALVITANNKNNGTQFQCRITDGLGNMLISAAATLTQS